MTPPEVALTTVLERSSSALRDRGKCRLEYRVVVDVVTAHLLDGPLDVGLGSGDLRLRLVPVGLGTFDEAYRNGAGVLLMQLRKPRGILLCLAFSGTRRDADWPLPH